MRLGDGVAELDVGRVIVELVIIERAPTAGQAIAGIKVAHELRQVGALRAQVQVDPPAPTRTRMVVSAPTATANGPRQGSSPLVDAARTQPAQGRQFN